MEKSQHFMLRMLTILAKMDDYAESMTSLPRRSRFVIIVLLCFCFLTLLFLYTDSDKPTVRSIDELKKVWNIGQFRHGDVNDHKHKSPLTVTHAQSSSYRFVDSSRLVIPKGTTFRLVIEARDFAGKRTTHGGDMWYATLNSLKPKASTSGQVVDNGDGTYDVLFYAGWEGVAKIDIILAHPKEACAFAQEKVWPMQDRAVWAGVFRVKGQRKAHTTTCLLRRNGTEWANKCEYWYPQEMGDTTLVCGKPEDKETWSCDDLYSIGIMKARIELAASELIEGKEYLFERENVMQIVEQGPKHVKLEGTDDHQPVALPPCQPDLPDPEIEGFWFEDKWHSLRCRNSQWENTSSVEQLSECLRGKEVYFLGDTTTRQLFEAFHEAIGLKFLLRSEDAHYRFFRHHPSLNVSVLYQAHPFLMTSSQVPLDETRFEVDVLDGLNTDRKCNYVILLSPWPHTYWDRASFVKRLELLKQGIDRLFLKCPKVPVVVRGPHLGSHGTFESSVYSNNIILREIRDVIKETLQGTGISFLDSWDLSVAYPSPNQLILPMEVVQQEMYLFMSYICKSPNRGAK